MRPIKFSGTLAYKQITQSQLVLIDKKKISHQEDITIPEIYIMKIKEIEKLDKYLDLGWELKNLWNMKVMVILIIVGTLGTVLKSLEKRLVELEIRERIETKQTTNSWKTCNE